MKNSPINNQSGNVLIIVALMLVVLLGIAAFAIDIAHLMVVRNELKNAADAGALAGASQLYITVGTGTSAAIAVNAAANDYAASTATINTSDGRSVEAPQADIQRGHWSFTNNTFTPNNSLASYNLNNFVGMSFQQLDADTSYINAVRVVASRGLDPGKKAASFFARFFGSEYAGFSLNSEAVAWTGFAGTFTADEPIAICKESVYDPNGHLDCTVGKMMNENIQTALWTNLEQDDNGGAGNVGDLVCNDANISRYTLNSGLPLTTMNGVQNSTFYTSATSFYNCWQQNSNLKRRPWSMTLPLIECTGPVKNKLVGAINVEVFWIVKNANVSSSSPNQYDEVPTVYDDPAFSCNCAVLDTACHTQCWADFLNGFGVGGKDATGAPIVLTAEEASPLYQPKTIYFKPSCSLVDPLGGPGGVPSNVLSKYPRLVK